MSKQKQSRLRLGTDEKLVLVGLYDYYFRFTSLLSDEGRFILNTYDENTHNIEFSIDMIERLMDAKSRIGFSRIIRRLYDKKLIFMLEDNPTNWNKIGAQPFLYGRGTYRKLISLTSKGLLLTRMIKTEYQEELNEAIVELENIHQKNVEIYLQILENDSKGFSLSNELDEMGNKMRTMCKDSQEYREAKKAWRIVQHQLEQRETELGIDKYRSSFNV